MLEFQEGGLFHLPIRCTTIARNGDLCESCQARDKKTQEKVRLITGTTIQGMLPSYLMGRITEPIPFWSRLYDGAWYRLKIESGCTISEETMARAKKAVATAYEGIEQAEPQAMPGKRRVKKSVTAVAPVAVPLTPVAPVPAPVTPVTPVTPVAAPKKRAPKQMAPSQAVTPKAVIAPQEVPVESVLEIKVRRREINGTTYYLGPKEKVYDLTFKCKGRLKDGALVEFHDSDEDL